MATANPTETTERKDNFELELNRVRENVRSRVDYKSKIQPLLSGCEKGEGMKQLYYPCCVAFDINTGDIYVTDHSNHYVKVFDSNCRYMFQFGDKVGKGKMKYPHSLVICGDRILISQGSLFSSTPCILNYQLDGRFISRIGRGGSGEMGFSSPTGLTIDKSNGDIYICDSGNYRVKILSKDFKFKSHFGKDSFSWPLDVKLTEDYIFVLDTSNPCLHRFDYDHVLQKSVIARGPGMQFIDPYSFFIDNSRNVLISDHDSNSILIFNSLYELIHKISVNQPTGITVDNEGRIIVSCQYYKNGLYIF